jgi:hypothetical protein
MNFVNYDIKFPWFVNFFVNFSLFTKYPYLLLATVLKLVFAGDSILIILGGLMRPGFWVLDILFSAIPLH